MVIQCLPDPGITPVYDETEQSAYLNRGKLTEYKCEGGIEKSSRGSLIGITRFAK